MPTMKFEKMVLLAALTATVLTAAIAGQAWSADADRPCRDDIINHCRDSFGDREATRQCMRDKFSQFNERCQAAITDRMREGSQDGPGTTPDEINAPPSPPAK